MRCGIHFAFTIFICDYKCHMQIERTGKKLCKQLDKIELHARRWLNLSAKCSPQSKCGILIAVNSLSRGHTHNLLFDFNSTATYLFGSVFFLLFSFSLFHRFLFVRPYDSFSCFIASECVRFWREREINISFSSEWLGITFWLYQIQPSPPPVHLGPDGSTRMWQTHYMEKRDLNAMKFKFSEWMRVCVLCLCSVEQLQSDWK